MVLRIACSLMLLVAAAWGHYRADNEVLVAEMPLPGKPAWSPDGRQLAFHGRPGDLTQVFVLDVETLEIAQVTDCPSDCREATWSPDGSEIAFLTTRRWPGAGDQLAIMEVETGQIRRVGVDMADRRYGSPRYPAWSPDGQRMVVLHGGWDISSDGMEGRDMPTPLLEIDPAGVRPTTVLLREPHGGSFGNPSFIEGGAAILYWTWRANEQRLFVMELGADLPREIGPVTRRRVEPALSPDGTALAYSSIYDGGPKGIWLAEFSEVPSAVEPTTWGRVKAARLRGGGLAPTP